MARTSITLNGYTISISPDGEYTFTTLPEELCRKMCIETDKGERWVKDSRFNYSTAFFNDYGTIPFGTAKAAVQYAIMKLLGYKKGDIIRIDCPK